MEAALNDPENIYSRTSAIFRSVIFNDDDPAVWSQHGRRNGSVSLDCTCNATHTVRYLPLGEANVASADIVLHMYQEARRRGVPPVGAAAKQTHVVELLEPPSLLPQLVWRGFSGSMSFRRDSAIHRPISLPSVTWKAGQELVADPVGRRDVGIWVAFCLSSWHTPIIEMLLASSLPVRSFGPCRPNQPQPPLTLFTEAGRATCRTHRLMLAIENHACTDYVSERLMQIMSACGAIPIVNRVASGMPDYASVLGSFPHVDISQPGWLEKVRRIVTNDTYYVHFVRQWHARGLRHRPCPLRSDTPKAIHCHTDGPLQARMPPLPASYTVNHEIISRRRQSPQRTLQLARAFHCQWLAVLGKPAQDIRIEPCAQDAVKTSQRQQNLLS